MNISDIISQAQSLQSKIDDAQNVLERSKIRGIGGNGECIIDMTGKYDITGIKLNPNLLQQDITQVEKIILQALSDAKSKADGLIATIMDNATAGVPSNFLNK